MFGFLGFNREDVLVLSFFILGVLLIFIIQDLFTTPKSSGIFLNNDYKLVKQKININEASAVSLRELPGIGEVIAGRIVQYRRGKGGISKVEDLLNIDGIGKVKLMKILPYLTVSDTDK